MRESIAMKHKLLLAAIPLSLLSSVVVAQSVDKVYEPTEVDRKTKITLKPQPPYTEEARKHEIEGKVVLRVVLRASGEITDVEVLQGLPYGLTEQCIKVVRKIKFEPAIKDGRAVSQRFEATYVFFFFRG